MSSTPSKPRPPPPPKPRPPPPPPPPNRGGAPPPASVPKPPDVAKEGPPGAFLLELMIYNGWPFKDHWAYWLHSDVNSTIGVLIHAVGNVRTGFEFQIRRSYDLEFTLTTPVKVIPLQWIDAKYLDAEAMLNRGTYRTDDMPVCEFEESVNKIKTPGKSLRTISNTPLSPGNASQRVIQKNCQTWIVESAEQLVKDGILNNEIAEYLCSIQD